MTISLQELVYFGAAWQLLEEDQGDAPITLRGGWSLVRIERSDDDHKFFAGIVEKRDIFGRVTDVVVAFAGANGADAAQGILLDNGVVLDEPLRAAALYESLWSDPRYANATIHVTGHSLGAEYTEFILAESIAVHGAAATAARADFTGFGVPGGYDNAAAYYGVSVADMDPLFTGYSAYNDPTISKGTTHLGTAYILPAFTGLEGVLSPFNLVAAHWPTTYISALGLPAWLTSGEQAGISAALSHDFVIPDQSIDPDYGNPGYTPMVVDGTAGADTLRGMGGDDVLIGGGGIDQLFGGGGHDIFRFEAFTDTGATTATADRIMDWQSGDRIDLSAIDANLALWGDQDFTLISGSSFTAPGQVRTWISGGNTWVAGNVDGDNAADFMIRIDGIHHLTAADFVFAADDGGLAGVLGGILPVPIEGLFFF